MTLPSFEAFFRCMQTKNSLNFLREFSFVGVTGFEPATPWSQTRCATNCATPRITVFICSGDSHHPGLDTTPRDCLFCLSVVGVTGFEPATPWSQTRCATNCATPRKPSLFYYIQLSEYRHHNLKRLIYLFFCMGCHKRESYQSILRRASRRNNWIHEYACIP